VRYRALDLLESEGRQPRGAMEIGEADATGALGGVEPPAFEDRGALRGCLGELKDGARRSIVLAFVEGFSHAEISETLGQPLGTVKSWILRGLEALRECMDR
jgi:RNA polymerase sigma-70 factor (ECF subfamily)